ncbi:MAG: HNH endonuclease [Myxococcaceae bacterium]
MSTLSTLSTAELLAHLATLASRDRVNTVDILLSLIEVETRQFHKELNYSSPWAYCTGHLHWTNGTTGRNFAAARLLRRFPAAADYLRDGRLNCATFLALKDVLTQENHRDLLNRATHLAEEKVLELVVAIAPKPVPTESLRRLPNRSPHRAVFDSTASTTPAIAITSTTSPRVESQAPASTSTVAQPPTPPSLEFTFEQPPSKPFRSNAQLEPLQKDVWLLKVPIDAAAKANLEEVQSLLSHAMPRASLGDVLLECVRRTRAAAESQKYGTLARRNKSTTRSGPSKPHAASKLAPPIADGVTVTAISGVNPSASGGEESRNALARPSSTPILGANGCAGSKASLEAGTLVSGADPETATPILGVNGCAQSESSLDAGTIVSAADPRAATPILGVNAGAAPIAHPISGVQQARNRHRAGLRPPRRPSRSVKRAVAERDGHCCAFVFANGQRCGSKYQLEFDHWRAYALGGEPSVENVRMLCKAHNLQCAIELFGEEFMARFIRPTSASSAMALRSAQAQTNRAASRSCTSSSPTGLPSASTTGS